MDVLPGFEVCDCRCHSMNGNCGIVECCLYAGHKLVRAQCIRCRTWVSEVAMANHACTYGRHSNPEYI